jgi:CheY-like chemotaxis protein
MRRSLFVDDEANRRMVYRPKPGANEYEIVEAGSGAKALQALSRQERDAVVLDCGLPDIEVGLQLMNEIRPQPKHDQGYADFYDWEAEVFGVKPADLLELQGALAWSFQPQNRGVADTRRSRL